MHDGNALLLESSELLARVQRQVDEEIQLRQQAEARIAALEAELDALKKKVT